MSDALSVRAFAKVLGVSHVAVLKAIERGRLRASVRVNPLGRPEIFDVERARQEWTANAGRATKGSTGADGSGLAAAPVTVVMPPVTTLPNHDERPLEAKSLQDAQLLAALELARQRRLANQLRERQLLPADAVKKLQFEALRTLRENMLNIPARIAGALAAETDVSRIHRLLDQAIREALTTTGTAYRASTAGADDASPSETIHG